MSDDSDRMTGESQKRRPPLWAIFLALLVSYPLSIGPIVGLCNRLGVHEISGPLALCYLPIMWLVEIIPGGERLLEWYVEFFVA
ncbi:MAG: hypothetical protein IAG10_04240 [Planctomycetaceae bacterium]|nr:hypothetical protein [Planctomycetaceae bacterium]